jgi:kynurenine 3-monooxygenase
LKQIEGFEVTQSSLPNYATMLELDLADHSLDPSYLYVLSAHPPCIAGAINGEAGPHQPRWFCMVGSSERRSFASTHEVRQLLRYSPQVLGMASEAALESFAHRECHHIGRKLSCSQLFGGKAVLLGDAAAPFPPIGQGVNAAMESAMVLDQCMAQAENLEQALRRYNQTWKPEAEAVSWISEKMILGNPLHLLRGAVTTPLGISVFGEAKRADISYSQVRRNAERLWPLWS